MVIWSGDRVNKGLKGKDRNHRVLGFQWGWLVTGMLRGEGCSVGTRSSTEEFVFILRQRGRVKNL